MAHIHVLAAEVVNKIAAGEVIERPASVVKELVENSLDAGAGELRVDVEEGGRKLVRVTDDGAGIPAEELPLAFATHATSKLRTAEDLFRVVTFGFRGEALASIGSVARVRLASRPAKGEGAEIVVENGEASPVRPAAAAPGTVVEVRNLFQNVPVRRKFLRSVEVETEQVTETVARFAIAHPKIRFELRVDGEPRQVLPPATRRARIAAFFGEEVAGALHEVDGEGLHAYFAPPQHSRLNTRAVHFFLNGRFIRDRVLLRAVGEAYREMLPHGRHPVAFLFLTLPASEVDVNVHPTKTEVRFRNAWRLHDRVAAALREKLTGADPARRVAAEEFRPAPGPVGEVLAFFGREPGAGDPGPALAVARPLVTTGRRVFQLHNRYLVEEVEDGVRVIDQHALHERVMLEDLRRQFASASVARQRLLLPAVVPLSPERMKRLDEFRELVESFGFEVDEFGRDAVAVRAVPALVADADPASLLADLLDTAEEADPQVPVLDCALEFLACRAAVKFGRRLAEEEIARLLERAAGLDTSATCAHGRPTAIKLTHADLERFFQR